MSDLEYTPRPYPHIVRDLLTTLTGGTVREAVTAPVAGPLQLNQLASRPIRRISHLEGVTDVAGTPVPVRFTNADFDLADADNDGLPDVVVFRDNGRKPIPGTTLTVNYYPTQIARPVPLTDLNVGSVVRTVLETFAREIAQDEQYLDLIYRSAFLDTAEGSGLDKVVALIGVTRLPARHPLVEVRFSRNATTGGKITIPSGTVVTDAATPPARYRTVADLTLEAGEQSRSVLAAGATVDTAMVAAGALDRLETTLGGISTASNPAAAYRESAAESDDALRVRARERCTEACAARWTLCASASCRSPGSRRWNSPSGQTARPVWCAPLSPTSVPTRRSRKRFAAVSTSYGRPGSESTPARQDGVPYGSASHWCWVGPGSAAPNWTG